jgi:hypothetical protein
LYKYLWIRPLPDLGKTASLENVTVNLRHAFVTISVSAFFFLGPLIFFLYTHHIWAAVGVLALEILSGAMLFVLYAWGWDALTRFQERRSAVKPQRESTRRIFL